MTPKTCIFRGFGAAMNHHSIAASLIFLSLFCVLSVVFPCIRLSWLHSAFHVQYCTIL